MGKYNPKYIEGKYKTLDDVPTNKLRTIYAQNRAVGNTRYAKEVKKALDKKEGESLWD